MRLKFILLIFLLSTLVTLPCLSRPLDESDMSSYDSSNSQLNRIVLWLERALRNIHENIRHSKQRANYPYHEKVVRLGNT